MKKEVWNDIFCFSVLMIFAGFTSIYLGFDRSLDVFNYHIYNPFAFLNDRLTTDFMPASKESYFNPLMDIPYYLAVKYLNNYPYLVGFLGGFSYALFLFMIYKITNLIFRDCLPNLFTEVSVIMASGVYEVLSNIGSLSHDIFIFDLILIVLYLLLNSWGKYCPKLLFVCGFISGVALGLKYSAIMFITTLVLSSLFFYKEFKNPIKLLLYYASGGALGFFLTNGWWMYYLWSVFGNPLFPYFNWLFDSPYIIQDNTFSSSFQRHVPEEYYKVWLYPFFFRFDHRLQIFEIVFVVSLLLFPFIDSKGFKKETGINASQADFLALFCAFGFIIWVHTFCVPRYFAPAMGLFAIIAFVFVLKVFYLISGALIKNKYFSVCKKIFFNNLMVLIIVISAFLPQQIKFMKKFHVNRVHKIDRLIYVEDMHIPDEAIVLTGVGVGIFVPFQNPKAKYIKNTNLYSEMMINKISDDIANSKHKTYLLSEVDAEKYINLSKEEIAEEITQIKGKGEKKKISKASDAINRLKIFGLNAQSIKCKSINTNVTRNADFYLCEMEKSSL